MNAVVHDERTLDAPHGQRGCRNPCLRCRFGRPARLFAGDGALLRCARCAQTSSTSSRYRFSILCGRVFARRRARIEHTALADSVNLLTVAFVERARPFCDHRGDQLAHGIRDGRGCAVLAQSISEVNVGSCLGDRYQILSR